MSVQRAKGTRLERTVAVYLAAALNDDARVGVVVHKRHGKASPGEQLVTMRLQDFARLLGGDL